jgi:hypothetical protein
MKNLRRGLRWSPQGSLEGAFYETDKFIWNKNKTSSILLYKLHKIKVKR